jgi:hypothetical protein
LYFVTGGACFFMTKETTFIVAQALLYLGVYFVARTRRPWQKILRCRAFIIVLVVVALLYRWCGTWIYQRKWRRSKAEDRRAWKSLEHLPHSAAFAGHPTILLIGLALLGFVAHWSFSS